MENSKTKMNILEAYIRKYNQFIILILGLPCSNKSEIAKELHIDLKLPIIKIK
jgi:adenylylsulfate kinase-like enzyme